MNILLDLDDTLIRTNELYRSVISESAQLIANTTTASYKESKALIENTDLAAAKQFGLGSKHRFPLSILTVYSDLVGKNPNPDVWAELIKLGYSVYDRVPKTFTDTYIAVMSLHYLASSVILITRGDKEVQLNRLKQTNLDQFFPRVEVVPTKNAQVFIDIITKYNLKYTDTWIIGDSLKADILPAIEIGLKAIHVDYGSQDWIHEHTDIIDTYYKVDSLTKAVEILWEYENG